MIGLNPFWGNNDGAIRLTHIRSGARHLIRNMARMLRSGQSPSSSNKLARHGFTSWSLETATLDYTGPMVLDGEFLPQTNEPITLSTSRPLTFLK
ncbi:MAG: hypothetical protein JKX72_03640 [Robiginitomaculum sp.]|nr:hypothetical protein [Robiginitomaculum sp.]